MDDGTATLHRCFAVVFPDLADDEIPSASVGNVPEWDSLASVTLMAVLEGEFGVEISELDLSRLRSYADVLDYLRQENRLP